MAPTQEQEHAEHDEETPVREKLRTASIENLQPSSETLAHTDDAAQDSDIKTAEAVKAAQVSPDDNADMGSRGRTSTQLHDPSDPASTASKHPPRTRTISPKKVSGRKRSRDSAIDDSTPVKNSGTNDEPPTKKQHSPRRVDATASPRRTSPRLAAGNKTNADAASIETTGSKSRAAPTPRTKRTRTDTMSSDVSASEEETVKGSKAAAKTNGHETISTDKAGQDTNHAVAVDTGASERATDDALDKNHETKDTMRVAETAQDDSGNDTITTTTQTDSKDNASISDASKSILDHQGTETAATTTAADSSSTNPSRSKSPPAPSTSGSAFAASGFGSLSNSTTSGFGTLSGSQPLSSFASGGPPSKTSEKPSTDASKPSPSVFGGSLGATSAFASSEKPAETASKSAGPVFGGSLGATSAFGGAGSSTSAFNASSGFGSLGASSGFGALSGAKLSTFASNAGTSSLTGKTAPKAAISNDVEDGEVDSGEEDNAGVAGQENDVQDERFYQQNLTTGEEAEQTLYTCRTKLYNFVASAESGKKEWKERGVGTLRLNLLDQETPTGTTDDKDINDKTKPKAASKVKTRARLIMRADGSHRVVLNTPILREIKFGDASGAAPKSGLVYFMASVDGGKLELLQLKMRAPNAIEMHEHIVNVQKLM